MNNNDTLPLIEKWAPYIKKMSRRFKNTIASQEDLEQYGIIGVLKAIKHYDPKRSSLDSFCYNCINTAIKVAAIENAYPVHFPAGTCLSNNSLKDKQHAALSGTMTIDSSEHYAWAKNSTFEEDIMLLDLIEKHDRDGMAKLYFIDNLTCQEIADQMKMSCSSVWKIINSIRNMLRKEMLNYL